MKKKGTSLSKSKKTKIRECVLVDPTDNEMSILVHSLEHPDEFWDYDFPRQNASQLVAPTEETLRESRQVFMEWIKNIDKMLPVVRKYEKRYTNVKS